MKFIWTLVAAFRSAPRRQVLPPSASGLSGEEHGQLRGEGLIDCCTCTVSFLAFGFALISEGSALASGLDEGNRFIGLSGFCLNNQAFAHRRLAWWMRCQSSSRRWIGRSGTVGIASAAPPG